MAKCRDPEVVLACFNPNDSTLNSVTIQHVTVFDVNGVPIASYYQDKTGSIIDASSYLGGGVVSLGQCEILFQCMKDKFIEGGLDNTFTNFRHTNQNYVVEFDNGDVDTFNVPSATGWTDQVNQISAGLDSIMPWAQTVESFCNIAGGCGGLPEPFVELNKMAARYTGFRVCPGEKVPVSVKYTSDQVEEPKELVIQYVETDTIYIDVCIDCETGEKTYTVNGAPYVPVCAIPCEEEFPAVPLSKCSSDTIAGNWCDVDIDVYEDPENTDDPLIQSDIIILVTYCDGLPPQLNYFTEDADGGLIEYPVVGEIRNCDNYDEAPEAEPVCRPKGSYTGKTFCYEKKSKFRLVEKQFEGAAGTVDISAEFGLPAGSIIATNDATIFSGANSDVLAAGINNPVTFTTSGTQPVCIKVMHGGAIPTDGASDGFTANDGAVYSFTGNITGDGTVSQSGNDYQVTAGTDNSQGAINWTSQGPATSATAFTTNQNPANSVRFFVATFDCSEAREYVSDCGEVQQWWDGNVQVDISNLKESDCCKDDPDPVVNYDYEFACVDGKLSVITTVTTDGVAVISEPVPIDPVVDCTNADDFELVRLCATDGFVHIYAYDKSDLSTIVADVTTSESCEVCQPFDIVDYWKLEGGVPGVNGSRWRENAAAHGPVETMFDGCGNHINGDADEVIVYPNWNVVDTPARFPLTGADFGTSQEYYYSWVYFPQGVVLEDNNGNTGEFIAAYVGGKDQKPVFQKSVANTSGANGVGLGTIGSYPAGLYRVAVELSDFSVYGGVNLRWSLDGGNTFVPIPAANIYSEPPTVKCVKVRVNCDGTMQTLDGLPFNPDAPNCSECEIKCPVIEDTITPPDYEFQTVLGCDDVDGDSDNFVNVTQETLIVDGVKTVTFYTDYGTETQAEYTLQGLFVDCATGVPIEEPPIVVDCEDWEILTVYDAIGTNGVNVERWNTNAITGEPISSVPSDVFTGAPDYSGMPAHDNGAPDGPIIVESDLLVLDQVNDQSQMRGWTYLYTPEPIRLRERHARAEAVDYFLGECCAPPVKVATGPYPNTAAVVSFDVSLPAGIHYVGFEVFDFSAYSGVDYQYSTDNGVTWARVPAAWLYTAKPRVTACQMKVCPETGLIADIRTGILNTTASLCEPELCGPVLRSDAQCAFQTFYRVNYPEVGTVEQQWTASAVNTSGVAGTSYLAGFTDTDNEGYPAHVNAPDSTISSNIASTTNVTAAVSPQDQAQSDFYIFLTEPTELREFNPTAEASGIWISETCGSSKMVEILDAPYVNQFANALDTYGPGCYRVRLYHSDFSANGVTRLQGRTAGGTWGNITPYIEKPTVSVVKGWACDDGNFYTLDKTETLDPTEYLCEDPRCVPSNCCPTSGSSELPQTIGRA